MLFIIEALIISPACIAWVWWLVMHAERVRLIHYGLMASVPMTSLTLMSTRPVKVSLTSRCIEGCCCCCS